MIEHFRRDFGAEGSGSGASWTIPAPVGSNPQPGDLAVLFAAVRGRLTGISGPAWASSAGPWFVGSPVSSRGALWWGIVDSWSEPVVSSVSPSDTNTIGAILLIFKAGSFELVHGASGGSSGSTTTTMLVVSLTPNKSATAFYFVCSHLLGGASWSGANEIVDFEFDGVSNDANCSMAAEAVAAGGSTGASVTTVGNRNIVATIAIAPSTGVNAIATIDTTPELTASVAVGTSAIATIDTTPELTASVVVGVNAIANLETTPELTASVVVGDSGPGSVDAIANLEITPELTASVAVIATAIANLATTPELTASVVVGVNAIATLTTTPGLTAIVELGAISPDWLALGTITPVINQWTPFEIESNGGASFRLVFANLGGVTIFRSHGVIRPVWDVAGSEVKGIGVRVFPTAEETLLSFPEPSDLVLKGVIRRFEVRKYLEQGHSSAESEWSCTLYDLVNQ